jgi:hypothetical protein
VLVLLQSVCLTGAVLLVVTFPEANVDNYSVVALRCAKNNAFLDPLDSAQLPATFLRDGQMITSDSTLVTVTGTGADTLSFQFTQEQEGMFRCRTELNEESDPESLAASPPAGYSDIISRYFIIQSANTPVNISCPIQPGALTDSYSVSWRQTVPVTKTFGDETFTLSEVVEPTERGVVFTCRVEITHTQDVSIDYDGTVSVRTRVLSTLDGEIEDVAAKLGQPASISCGFTTEDTDFRLLWNLDGEEYVCEDSGTEPDISCTANAANIVLQIENTTVLGEGFHTVQCILEPAIPPEFMDDPSFDPQFGENIVREATLTIIGEL